MSAQKEVRIMTEEWLLRLANQIKEKERMPAEESARTRRRVTFLKQKGPAFWKAFSDSLDQSVGELKNLLEGDVTLAEGPLTYTFNSTTSQIDLTKSAFPAVRFSAAPHFEREVAEITYHAAGANSSASVMQCQFLVNDGRLTMRLDGRHFVNPADAATFVMERLFRISVARPESRDSHLGRVGSE
jgi:hypothetical protein